MNTVCNTIAIAIFNSFSVVKVQLSGSVTLELWYAHPPSFCDSGSRFHTYVVSFPAITVSSRCLSCGTHRCTHIRPGIYQEVFSGLIYQEAAPSLHLTYINFIYNRNQCTCRSGIIVNENYDRNVRVQNFVRIESAYTIPP